MGPPASSPLTPPGSGGLWGAASRLLPRSLVARVFALYSLSLVAVVGLALLLFYRFQFDVELEDAQVRADAMVSVIAPMIADSAVIGDYDTIRRTLERAVPGSSFAAISFIDLRGGQVTARPRDPLVDKPPMWLQQSVEGRLHEVNLPIAVGGQDYGVLRLSFASDRIALGLWEQTQLTLALAVAGVLLGLVLIRFPLVRWLGQLSSVRAFDAAIDGGTPSATLPTGHDAPSEFRETFAVLGRAAANLQAQRAQAEATLGAISDAVFTLDLQGHVVLANPAGFALSVSSGVPLLGARINDLLPGVLSEEDIRRGTLNPWPTRRLYLPAGDKGKGRRVVNTTLSAVRSGEGRVAGYVLACHDITEEHQLTNLLSQELHQRQIALIGLRSTLEALTPGDESNLADADDLTAISEMLSYLARQLKARGDQLDAIFALSPDGFISFDARRRVNYVSPTVTRLTGLGEAELLGQTEASVEQRLSALMNGQRSWSGFDGLRRQQQARPAAGDPESRRPPRETIELRRPGQLVLEIGLHMGSGEGVSQVLSLRDVTHETLIDQMKSEFLSTAAHELRTPMASIYGFTELLMRRKPTPEKQAEILETIHRQSVRMITIINELLDLARIESRRGLDFAMEPLDLVTAIPQWLGDFQPPAERAAPRLEFEPAAARVLADPQKMQQALGNVVSNAYKYSPQGGEVVVRVRMSPSDNGGPPARVNIDVVDRGIGLDAQQLRRVGERFWRADASGNIPGTGLGMSIVKEIIVLHGGGLELASAPGEGTTVTLWMPVKA